MWLIPCNQKRTGSLDRNTPYIPESSTQNGIHSKNMTIIGNFSTATKLLNFSYDKIVPWKLPKTKHASTERSRNLHSLWRKVITYSLQNAPQAKLLRLKNHLITKMIFPVSDYTFKKKWRREKWQVKRQVKQQVKQIDDRYGDGWHKWVVVELT